MFNFTKAETNALLFVVIILLVSGIYHLISPSKSLQPAYDYSAMDSAFKRLSQDNPITTDTSLNIQPANEQQANQPKPDYPHAKTPPKKETLSPGSININSASEKELQKLPRIGPSKAKLIVEYRTEHGKFSNVDELLKIKGIGEKTLEKLKLYITLD